MPNGWSARNWPAAESPDVALEQAPPLRVWGWVAMVVLLLAALAWPEYRRMRRDDDFLSVNRQRLATFAATPGPGPRIVAIGNSLLFAGTWPEEAMVAAAAAAGDPDWHVLCIARSKADYPIIAPLLDPVLDVRPDLVILQSDLLFEAIAEMDYGEYLSYRARSLLRQALGRPSLRPHGVNLMGDRERLGHVRQDEAALARYLAFRRKSRMPFIPREEVAGWLGKAERAGILVMVLEMPRSLPVRRQLQAIHAEHGEADFEQWLRAQDSVVWLACPQPFALDRFSDFTHLNAQGREEFVPWLIRTLGVVLSAKAEGRDEAATAPLPDFAKPGFTAGAASPPVSTTHRGSAP